MKRLIEVAHEVGLNIMENALLPDSVTGLYYREEGYLPGAILSKNIHGCSKLEKVALATCIGTHAVISGEEVYVVARYDDYKTEDPIVNEVEYRWRRKAVQIAVPTEQLVAAFTSGIKDVGELAEHFNVTDDFMVFRLKVWEISDESNEVAFIHCKGRKQQIKRGA